MSIPGRLSLACAIAFALTASIPSFAQNEPLRVLFVTPSGIEVPEGRQIVIQFDRKVVPVGRMERTSDEIPVTIEPALACEWRWLDTSSLACELAEDDAFRPATRYRLTLRPGIRTESGATLAEAVEHEFATERPQVTDTGFEQWLGPGSPQFTVTFNQRMAEDVLRKHLFFETDAGARFPLEVELARTDVEEPERHWRVRPARELPLDASVHLTAEKGLSSTEGPLPIQENHRVVSVFTFPAHGFLGIRCYDNNDQEITVRVSDSLPPRPCNPMNTVEVLFAAPVVKEVLRDHLKLEPDLAGGREDYDPWDAVYSYSRLEWARSELEI